MKSASLRLSEILARPKHSAVLLLYSFKLFFFSRTMPFKNRGWCVYAAAGTSLTTEVIKNSFRQLLQVTKVTIFISHIVPLLCLFGWVLNKVSIIKTKPRQGNSYRSPTLPTIKPLRLEKKSTGG